MYKVAYMTWAPVALAALLLAAIAYPFLAPRLRREMRARETHRGHVVHVYVNYDEDLHFEPREENDILPVARRELERFGYSPADETAVVPRTFRRRIAGDEHLRLWNPSDASLRPVWVCTWSGVELGSTSASVPPALIRAPFERRDSDRSIRALTSDDELADLPTRSYCTELPESTFRRGDGRCLEHS